ncbi:F0F1 ATP synthase subunit gamma [Limobrevibacterium gyesilva]|uniref:F0F1 ATP synthase subunit gamma n=1 Tax=Limobrevibacterium gyesilva TaxID=2991712 RepID=A0AA41YTW8_9PROT|nr:FoF1 ATP synthase subunit gamma [Limobrevibacterium gyesilva]MCW3476410.1 F0F1 ATP synthase subunit gamma [Limobrevibacterium gyesilva]
MTERLEDISGRIHGTQQLQTVVSAMRSIAAARAQQSRALLPGVTAYARVVAGAIAQALRLLPADAAPPSTPAQDGTGLVLFCPEQGFVGAYARRVLDAAGPVTADTAIFLVGSRGVALAEERRLRLAWHGFMAPHADSVAVVAARIADALYDHMQDNPLARVDLIFPSWSPGRGIAIERRSLLPLDPGSFAGMETGAAPLTTLPTGVLLERLAEEYVYAQLCHAAMAAFTAENEARVQTMAAAHANIQTMLAQLQARERQVRQETITAEVVELAAGAGSLHR